jgi:preprotein translocase subunit SecY
MFSAVIRAFRTADLRNKLLFTLAIVAIYRLGSFIPAPNVDFSAVRQCLDLASAASSSGSASGPSQLYQLVNLFSGGALLQLSVFALGIMPYITASIITQLLRVVIPRFETLHQEGQAGQAKLTQYTRYLTIALAILQSTTLVSVARTPGAMFGSGCSVGLLSNTDAFSVLLMVIVMTAGTGLIMWMGELITERGIGNGMSLLIFTSIASAFPGSITQVWNSDAKTGPEKTLMVLGIGVIIVALVIMVEQSQRRIPVQYAKRMVGRREYGGQSTYIPIKVNMAGVVPVIFASSLLYLPALIAQFNQPDKATGQVAPWVSWVSEYLTKGDHPLYMAMYFLLILGFTYFYVAITFNPQEVSDNMKQYGGFIPGIRAGRPTTEFLEYVLSRITLPGAIYLGLIALIPLIAFSVLGTSQNFPFGGTSILIIVGVGLESVKQINAQMQERNYEGLLK